MIDNSKNSTLNSFVLHKTPNKEYKILQLTDIQVIDALQQPFEHRLCDREANLWIDYDKCAFNQVREMVKIANPDFIAVTGDNVYGQFDNSGKAFISFVNLMESFGIPWSFVNGNHDGEMFAYFGPNRQKIPAGKGMQWQGEYVKIHTKNCLYELGDKKMGYGNYTVTLLENEKPFYTFTFLDTHACDGEEIMGINDAQVKFYQTEIERINKIANKTVPNFLFFHIPIEQFKLALYSLSGGKDIFEIAPKGQTDANGNFGENKEQMVHCVKNDNFWKLIKSLGSTKGIFVGHDHINNSSIMYEGIRLTFGTKTGIYDYHDQQGATLITIKNDSSFAVKHILK